MIKQNVRGDIIAKRTYCRPLDADYTARENWDQVVDRVINHSTKLWADAGGIPNTTELEELRNVLLTRKQALVAGRTLWLGGTELAYRRPCCQFNCAFTRIESIYDMCDTFWLLLNGAGVGFNPCNSDNPHNFIRSIEKPVDTLVIYSTKPASYRGEEETFIELSDRNRTLNIRVGDSANGWVKALEHVLSLPKIMDVHERLSKVVIDCRECRGAGQALAGYGWQCIGSDPLAKALERIITVMHGLIPSATSGVFDVYQHADSSKEYHWMTPPQIHDIINILGEVLSTRRSAQIAQLDADSPYLDIFISFKSPENLKNCPWRMQSNNSVVFLDEVDTDVLQKLKDQIAAYGTEPGIINGAAALKKAPWFTGLNPCAEILLANKGFCNLVEVNVASFYDNEYFDIEAAERVVYLLARHNYRQTCVDLRDGILQPDWHTNNERLRLCGVSITGIGEYEPDSYNLTRLKRMATYGAYSMAMELGLELPKNITTIKPSGTVSKVMGTSEGIHTPMGQYVFNWVVFNGDDPLVSLLAEANYKVMDHPTLPAAKIICLPEEFNSKNFTLSEHGFAYDDESIEEQFNRYLRIESVWCDQNISNTMYYKPKELDTLFDLIEKHWDNYVAFSFAPRQDLSKTKEEIKQMYNAPYLPQELVTREEYYAYIQQLKPVDVFAVDDGEHDIEQEGCANGACPIR